MFSPLSIASQAREDGALACAEYRLGDYVAVWYLSNDEIALQVSYICAWKVRDEERALAEGGEIASMTFA